MNDNKSGKIKFNNEILESIFYDIRDEKVMLDLDLAAIFGYETKDLNRMVKNNIDKFNDNSRFQLTKDEVISIVRCKNFTTNFKNFTEIIPSRCKIFTLNSTRGSNIKYMPHAFTIEGIKTLITILKPKTETAKQNVLILNEYINTIKYQITEKWPSEANNYEIVKFESGVL